jgi:hypothetical protein
MQVTWRQKGQEHQQTIAGDWETAAVEARRLIVYAGATHVVIHEEEAAA